MVVGWKVLFVTMAMLAVCQAAPVLPSKDKSAEDDIKDSEHTGLAYDKYLRLVVKTMENDPELKKKLDDMSLDDVKAGKMESIMDGVSDKIRARLDDLKRAEIQRLRQVAKERFAQATHHRPLDQKHIEDMTGHVDVNNMQQFGGKDFEKLIKKATTDLDKADAERKEEFKRYEMQKEIERRQKLKEMDEERRKAAEREHEERRKKLKEKHLKHPGSKAQLEEVWEETDHLDKEDFNPRTFFELHDTNSDHYLDGFELEALFIKEVEKLYADTPDVDAKEKLEEINRMREHVQKEFDKDGDHMVSKREFMDAAKADDFDSNKGWDDLEDEDQYTEDELEKYEKNVEDEMKNLKIKMQQEHDQYKKAREQKPGEPVLMNQDKVLQEAADKEAQKFHQTSEQVQKMAQRVAEQVKVAHQAQDQQQQQQ